jgi:F-type H+-transporting ATPase subunit epsilon
MHLRLVTPERLLIDTDVEEVYAPGILGEFGVLPLHITFLTALTVGAVRYRASGREHHVAISGGFAEVVDDTVTILADTAELADEIDVERAKAARARAISEIDRAAGGAAGPDLQSAVSRALNRLAVAGRAGRLA